MPRSRRGFDHGDRQDVQTFIQEVTPYSRPVFWLSVDFMPAMAATKIRYNQTSARTSAESVIADSR